MFGVLFWVADLIGDFVVVCWNGVLGIESSSVVRCVAAPFAVVRFRVKGLHLLSLLARQNAAMQRFFRSLQATVHTAAAAADRELILGEDQVTADSCSSLCNDLERTHIMLLALCLHKMYTWKYVHVCKGWTSCAPTPDGLIIDMFPKVQGEIMDSLLISES